MPLLVVAALLVAIWLSRLAKPRVHIGLIAPDFFAGTFPLGTFDVAAIRQNAERQSSNRSNLIISRTTASIADNELTVVVELTVINPNNGIPIVSREFTRTFGNVDLLRQRATFELIHDPEVTLVAQLV